jgi:hypothetical protein
MLAGIVCQSDPITDGISKGESTPASVRYSSPHGLRSFRTRNQRPSHLRSSVREFIGDGGNGLDKTLAPV